MTVRKSVLFMVCCLILLLVSEDTAYARRRRHRRYSGPPPTHPVILWSRTLEESKDPEQRKVMAFKLSQYSQPIFQPKVIATLMTCSRDPDVQIKVLCTKALGGAKSAEKEEAIRTLLIDLYKTDPLLKNTVVRTFLARKDNSEPVEKLLLQDLSKTEDPEEILALLGYFEGFEKVPDDLIVDLVPLYEKRSNIKVRRSIARVLAARASGQDKVIQLLAKCAEERDTPLALNCLSGLQTQAKKDARAWAAVQKTIQSDDPDVLLATLDVINALPETKNSEISKRLLDLIDDVEDPDIEEKAVLALGVCGDQTEQIVSALEKVFKKEKTEEATRIAAALTLGKQAAPFPDKAKDLLLTCTKDGATQTLKTACQLGLKDLETAAGAHAPASTAAADEKKPAG